MTGWVFTSRCVTPDAKGKVTCAWSTEAGDPTARNRAVADHRKATGHQSYMERMRRGDAA